MGVAIAAYTDVPSGVWYEDAVNAFLEADYLDATQTRFRGGDLANRAEFVKLVVQLNGGVLSTPPAVPSFNDVAPGTWYYSFFEEAGEAGWVRGDGSCYGTKPCYARPGANINRAEAAAIINRAFSLDATGASAKFADNPSGQWYTQEIQTAADHCILQGDGDTGRVRPSDNMNRAEMVVMLHRVDQNLEYGKDCGEVSGEPAVTDVVSTSSTVVEVSFNVSLDQTAAADAAMYTVTGPNGEVAVSSASLVSDDTVSLTLADALTAGAEYTLNVENMKSADGTTFSDSATFTGYSALPQGDGNLEVSVSSKNPVGDTVPKGAVGVVMTSVDLTAKDDDVTVENLTILHEGFGSSDDITGVYGVINGERVTRKRTLDSQTTTATVRFSKPLVIKKGSTVTLDIAADILSTAATSGEHALTLEVQNDVFSNAKAVTGNFPIRGSDFRVAAVAAGTLTISYRSVTPSKVKVGDKNAILGKWEVSVDSTEDQTIYSMTVENDGTTGDGDLANLKVTRSDGTVVTNTVAQTVADFATFVFDPPLTILEGDKLTLDVRGDVAGGAAKTAKLHFDESSDIFAVGSLYGYGVNGQLYGSLVSLPTETATLPTPVSIDAGQFTIGINGPSTQNFTPDDNDAVLANINFDTSGDEDIDIEELYIAIQGTTSTGAAFVKGRNTPSTADEINEMLQGVEIRNKATGRTVSGVRLTDAGTNSSAATTGTATGAYQLYRFDDFIVRGKENYEFRADFIDNSATANAAPRNGDRFRVHICGEPTHVLDSTNALIANTTGCTFGGLITASTAYQMKVKGLSTNDRVGDVRPRGTISGVFQDIKTSSLALTVRSTGSADSTVSNAKSVPLLRFEARASEAKDVLVTNFIFESANEFSLTNGNNYALWVDSTGDGTVDKILEEGVSNQGGQVSFNTLLNGGFVVPKEQTVIFEVHADIASSLTGTSPTLSIRFDTGATFALAEEADDGSSLSGIACRNPGNTDESGDGSATGCDTSLTASPQIILDVDAYGKTYTLKSSGDLYVTQSTVSVRNHQLLGGKLENEILRLQFHAEFEDIEVTDLVFTASGAGATNFATNVNSLELYTAGATTKFATATVGGCTTNTDPPANSMCVRMNNDQFVVKKGADTDVLVRPVMKSDEDGSVSGNSIALKIDPTSTNYSGTGAVRAQGALSSFPLNGADSDAFAEGEVFIGRSTAGSNNLISGPEHKVVHAKLAALLNDNPDPNGTSIPSGTAKPIGQFLFRTYAHNNSKNGLNDWTLSGIIFNVNATNVQLGTVGNNQSAAGGSEFYLYNKANNTVKHQCLANKAAASGALTVTCRGLQAGSVNVQLDAGTDTTFVLESNVSNPKIANTNSTLQVSLSNFSNLRASTFSTTLNTGGTIDWADKDSSESARFLWIENNESTVNSTSYTG
jgi:hypothetical protein